MASAKGALLAVLVGVAVVFSAYWARTELARRPRATSASPGGLDVVVGAITDFLDTLGIGSFATTTAAFRLTRRVDDRAIPGTLNVGHALPTVAQALIYVTIVRVETTTLIVMIAAATLGGFAGAGIVSRWPRRVVRLAVGVALLVAVAFMGASAIGVLPKGGEEMALAGGKLWVGAAANWVLGALMCAGVGLYAPCMILVSVLGMNPTAAFPIMMGSCAFLMQTGGFTFIRARAYDLRGALGLTAGGVPAVLVAAYWVRSLSLGSIRWLVIAVSIYTSVTLLVAALREPRPSTG